MIFDLTDSSWGGGHNNASFVEVYALFGSPGYIFTEIVPFD